ncbi:ABC transporter permease [Arthrobacter sp. ATA002]|uniref:ABC transporter permease n=1 Tax=Arthrobacter sp. ATA002 TaxID=2991715 RepID=UPI0022A7C260|nr:ABC transporter permease [Arthrobacter sp. ATA002]WAP52222.1 ABC transporter permease [Arthrobacter sp. ATA002]
MTAGDILRSAVSNTFRSKVRTALTVVAIFIGAFTLTLTSAIGAGVSDYIDKQVGAIGGDDLMTVAPAAEAAAADDGPKEYDPDGAATQETSRSSPTLMWKPSGPPTASSGWSPP